jgi:hypothetical protein
MKAFFRQRLDSLSTRKGAAGRTGNNLAISLKLVAKAGRSGAQFTERKEEPSVPSTLPQFSLPTQQQTGPHTSFIPQPGQIWEPNAFTKRPECTAKGSNSRNRTPLKRKSRFTRALSGERNG